MNISKFTQKSVQAVQDLEKVAYEYGNQEVEQEHLLYALLTQEDSLILKLIEKMDINKEYFINVVKKALDAKVKVSGGDLRFGQYLNKSLVNAENEAKAMGDEYVSVEHLFLSLLTQPSPGMKKIFDEFGITRERFLLEGNVQFEHVEFGYNPDKVIIHDFSADVHDGQKIAIVGPTGAGKTTMVKLLMRFYDVNKGAIKVDGHDVKNFNRSELHEMFGMVLQDTWLFSGTIMENIRYGRLDATDEEVIAAAKAAHIHNFIMQQPGGYQMVLDEETSNISQGQKQLLTIARAILADNKILILDEATSSVDTRTEMQIQKAMDNLMKGRTSFVIAHRLSTIKDADLILVMKDGDIIEQGNHEELLAAKGFYADLYNSQFDNSSSELCS